MPAPTAWPLRTAEVWDRQMHLLVRRFFAARALLVPLPVTALFVACLRLDPVPWRLWLLGGVGVAAEGWMVAQHLRVRRRPLRPIELDVDMFVALALIACLLVATGGVESPLILMVAVFGLIAGLHPAGLRALTPLLGLAALLVTGMAASAIRLGAPRPPSFFLANAGGGGRPAYAIIVGLMAIMGTLLFGRLGARVRGAFTRAVDDVEDARRQALDALQGRNHELMSIADTIAHEIKNPLAAIRSLAQLVQRSAPEGGRDHERLAVMLREIDGLRRVVDEFRSFARPLHPIALRPVSLDVLAREVAMLLEAEARARRVSIDVVGIPPVTLSGDPQKLKQALLNVLQNAVDATAPSRAITISITELPATELVEVAVHDGGPGLSAEVAARLFQPGFTTKAQGSGVGLLVARSIAQQHGGDLTLENDPCGGCVARLRMRSEAPAPFPAAIG